MILFIHSFIHLFIHSFMHSVNLFKERREHPQVEYSWDAIGISCLFIHSFIQSIHSFTHLLIYSFIHSFNHPFIQEKRKTGRAGTQSLLDSDWGVTILASILLISFPSLNFTLQNTFKLCWFTASASVNLKTFWKKIWTW